MESKLIPDRIVCATHPDEIVIRVSMNPQDSKLFYCRECLTEPKSDLIKYQDLLQHLSLQHINQDLSGHKITLPQKIEDFHKDQNQIETEISEQISQEKQKVDEGIRKIERQFAQLVKALREATYKRIEGFSKSFNEVCEEFSRRVSSHEELSTGTNILPTKEELSNKILASAGSSTEVENNLKAALNELQIKKASSEDRNIEDITKMKKKLEETVINTFIIPPKTQKDYETRIKSLQNLLEALLFGLREDIQVPDDGNPDLHAEMMRHIKSGKSLDMALQAITKSLETKSNNFHALLDEKFQVVVAKPVCPGAEGGLTTSEAKAYRCKTCIAQSSDLGDSDVICESCAGYCHKGHDVEFVGIMNYYCQCQFTMGICQLSTQCNYKFTVSSYYRMATYKCKVCEMASSRILCGYCARMCHKEHGTNYNGIQSSYCDCRGLFTFCKYHEQNPSS